MFFLCIVLEFNPQTKEAIIDFEEGNSTTTLELLDTNGNVLERIKFSANKLSLNFTKLETGRYALKCESNSHTFLKLIDIK